MKASEFATMILNEIQENGADFELAGTYWTERNIIEHYNKKLKADIETREDFFDILGTVMDQSAIAYMNDDLHYFTDDIETDESNGDN